MPDTWAGGDAYETFMGRWSRRVAAEFVTWLDVAPGGRWCDVGCGTGALSTTVLERAEPAEVVGVDPSEAFVAHATATVTVTDARARFVVGTMPPVDGCAAVVSGLVLNFVPDPATTVAAMAAAARRGGTVGVYVWDYAGGMELLRRFWDAVAAVDPDAEVLDERRRFDAVCRPDALAELFADLDDVSTRAVEVATPFTNFEDYWQPFLGGQGPAPTYLASVGDARRQAVRAHLETQPLPTRARAWAVRGRRP